MSSGNQGSIDAFARRIGAHERYSVDGWSPNPARNSYILGGPPLFFAFALHTANLISIAWDRRMPDGNRAIAHTCLEGSCTD